MEVKTLPLGLIRSNCYLIKSERAAIVIDPGFPSEEVLTFLRENEEKDRLILLTHVHFDHIGGAAQLHRETGTLVGIGRLDGQVLDDPDYNLTVRFHARTEIPAADRFLEDGETLTVGDLTVKTFLTPGHSIGGMCYLVEDTLFSGDTLFAGSVGRTDTVGGDFNILLDSIGKLYNALPAGTTVCPGHGPSTTLEEEKWSNPFLQ